MYELIGFRSCEVETLGTHSEVQVGKQWCEVEAQEGSAAQIEGVFGSAAGKETAAQSLVLK